MGPMTRTAVAHRHPTAVGATLVVAVSVALGGCSLFSSAKSPPPPRSSLFPRGSIGYVVCPNAVTPVELARDNIPEPDIPLPISGTPAPGDFAIATSPNGHWAYVVTSQPVAATPSAAPKIQNLVVPINLVTQRAGTPIVIPGTGSTHSVVVFPSGSTLVASVGSTLVPIDLTNNSVGTPLDLGVGHTVFGMALNPAGTALFALVTGAVIPVDTGHASAGAPILTGLTVSSVYSPHGIAISPDGSTLYVVGQGGKDFGGRLLPISVATGALQPEASFDPFGIASPASLIVSPTDSTAYVVDSANNWVNPVTLSPVATPTPPVRLPALVGVSGGTQHPSDIALALDGVTAFIVDGFNSVIPYDTASQGFGRPVKVCTGASSMAIAPSP
jgi:DNA-binding beta-propeller fold protein YncE